MTERSEDDTGSITALIDRLRAGDPDAGRLLWNRYVHRLVGLARFKLGGTSRRAADEEDVAVCAFENFLKMVDEGRYRKLEDRKDLWQLLTMLTSRRASSQRRYEDLRRKMVVGESAFIANDETNDPVARIDSFASHEPTPADAAEILGFFDALEEDELQRIASLRIHGYSNQEIATLEKCSTRKVERKVQRIKKCWEHYWDRGSVDET